MKKYFILFLFSVLFLGSCAKNKKGDDADHQYLGHNDEQHESLTTQGGAPKIKKDVAVEDRQNKESDSGSQKGDPAFSIVLPPQSDFIETWQCLFGQEELRYTVNNNPNEVDDEGNKILCKILRGYKSQTTLLFYATIVKDFCNKKILELVDSKKKDGWSCSKKE